MGKRYFDVHRDFAVIKDGGFFCQACLMGKEKTTISPDPRYCQNCYDFLREALETDTRWRHSASMLKLLVGEAKVAGTKFTTEFTSNERRRWGRRCHSGYRYY